MKSKQTDNGFMTKQQPFSGLFGAIIGSLLSFVLTFFGGTVYVQKEYISIDNLDDLINSYLVTSGLVSEDILGSEVNDQMDMIASTLTNLKNATEETRGDLEKILTENGIEVQDTSQIELLNTIDSICKDYVLLSEESSQYKDKTLAEIMPATLVVDGEKISTNMPNSVAKIENSFFYSESFLNSILDDPLSADLSDSTTTVYYGNERAEKTVFTENLITDMEGFNVYSVGNGESFTMGTDTFDNGFVEKYGSSARFYANLKGEYSKITFEVGHIDGSTMESETLYIYTKNGNDPYRLIQTYELTPDMFPDEKSVEINYADGIQIVMEGSYSGLYALANIYLYR